MADGQDDSIHNSMTGPVSGRVVQARDIHVTLNRQPKSPIAAELAVLVARAEQPVLNQLLGDQAASPVADTPFAQVPMGLVSWRTDGGDQHGSLQDIAKYYGGLECGRLVVTGEPGAGKTVLLLRLVLDLLRGDTSRRVPVRLSLPTFDAGPGVSLDDLRREPAAAIAARFENWVISQLHASFGLSKRDARRLVRNDEVLPVLDGLDEMDADDSEPLRANAVLRALNRWPQAVVLACRSSRYRELAEPLQTATVIEVQPLTREVVATYLTARFPDAPSRWKPVLDRLRAPREDDVLATALCSPLRLYLAATAHRIVDPTELLRLTGHDAIDQYLLDRFVPAVTTADPRYDTADVRRWLASLAREMDENAGRGRSGSDLEVTDLWRVAGRWLPRLLGQSLTALVLIIGVLLVYHEGNQISGPVVSGTLLTGVIMTVAFNVFIGGHALCPNVRALGSLRHLKWLKSNLLALLKACALISWILSCLSDRGVALAMFSMMLATVSIIILRGHPAEVVPRPGTFMRRALWWELAAVVTVVVPAGAAVMATADDHRLFYAGFLGTLALTGVLMNSPWCTYFAGLVLATNRGALPWRTARFLDWALDAGLLRTSGAALQFRHREFQRHLVREKAPRLLPT